jgi:pimeloyl-ACP methyl ester carboxylesterase
LKVPARVWKAVFAGILQEDFSHELSKIKLPTLIVWGDRDAICSRKDQEALVRSIPTSRLVVYSETGHALHWEEPEHFADDLMEFTLGLDRRMNSID